MFSSAPTQRFCKRSSNSSRTIEYRKSKTGYHAGLFIADFPANGKHQRRARTECTFALDCLPELDARCARPLDAGLGGVESF